MSLRKDVYQTKKLLNLDKLNVLIIDDFNFMARLMEAMLLEIGIGKTFMARNLEDAQAVLNKPKNAIDLIIMDWPMPHRMGLNMLKWVRRHSAIQVRFLPIMVCGSKLTSEDLNTARNAGATEFLVKPLSAQKLASRVKYMIEKPRAFVQTETFFGPDRRRVENVAAADPEQRGRAPLQLKNFYTGDLASCVIYPVDERLKVKAGLPANKDAAGLIPAARIEKAQKIIEKSSDLMNAEFGRIMKEMTALYNGMTISKSMSHDEVRANQLGVSKMRHLARNIREMTETYNQSLVYDISKELYSFCRVMNSERVESYTILKGYLDTLNISYARKLSDRNSPAALELKRIINKAVSQYA